MRKSELVKKISESAHISQDEASIAIDRTFDFIKLSLKKNQKITIHNFGTFTIKGQRGSLRAHPRRAESITVSFKPSPKIMDVL